MWYTEVAAFDPIFFLHHCNVDRLLALWQVTANVANWQRGLPMAGSWQHAGSADVCSIGQLTAWVCVWFGVGCIVMCSEHSLFFPVVSIL
jgi:hypothetical protein